jgi:hypothetical protein
VLVVSSFTCIDRLADELEVEPEDGLEIEVEHAG